MLCSRVIHLCLLKCLPNTNVQSSMLGAGGGENVIPCSQRTLPLHRRQSRMGHTLEGQDTNQPWDSVFPAVPEPASQAGSTMALAIITLALYPAQQARLSFRDRHIKRGSVYEQLSC